MITASVLKGLIRLLYLCWITDGHSPPTFHPPFKTEVTKKKAHQISRKMNISYLLIGGKKCSFFEKFGVLCFLVTSVLQFVLLLYYRRPVIKSYRLHKIDRMFSYSPHKQMKFFNKDFFSKCEEIH